METVRIGKDLVRITVRNKVHRARLSKAPGVRVVGDRVIVAEEQLGAVLGSLRLWKRRRRRGEKPGQVEIGI